MGENYTVWGEGGRIGGGVNKAWVVGIKSLPGCIAVLGLMGDQELGENENNHIEHGQKA